MAEPVGIIGTAAGLVSLGLQLYGEISNYLDAVKGRQEDLDFARRQCMNLKRCIDAIDTAITSPTFLLTGSRDTLDASVQDCQRELGALNELVLRLQGPPSPASTVSVKLREKGRKLAFPFLRKGMQELESRLESTINVLQLSTQTLGLDVLRTTHVRLGNVKSVMNDVRITTVDACAKIDNLSTNHRSVKVEYARAVGVVKPANMRIMHNSLVGCATPTAKATEYGCIPQSGKAFHRAGKETYLCSCIEHRNQKHRETRWGPIMIRTKWREDMRHSSKCPLRSFMRNQYDRSYSFEFIMPALQPLTGKAVE
ncbi:ankyrin repeat-containing protein [Colletotrichum asianum]